jgi:hypothetical protein
MIKSILIFDKILFVKKQFKMIPISCRSAPLTGLNLHLTKLQPNLCIGHRSLSQLNCFNESRQIYDPEVSKHFWPTKFLVDF